MVKTKKSWTEKLHRSHDLPKVVRMTARQSKQWVSYHLRHICLYRCSGGGRTKSAEKKDLTPWWRTLKSPAFKHFRKILKNVFCGKYFVTEIVNYNIFIDKKGLKRG